MDNSWSFPSEVKTGRLGSPYFQEVAIVENTVSLSWMPPGGDKIVTGYKLYIADELGKVFKLYSLICWKGDPDRHVKTLVIRIENLIKTRMLELSYWSQLSLHLQSKDSTGENDTSLDSIH